MLFTPKGDIEVLKNVLIKKGIITQQEIWDEESILYDEKVKPEMEESFKRCNDKLNKNKKELKYLCAIAVVGLIIVYLIN